MFARLHRGGKWAGLVNDLKASENVVRIGENGSVHGHGRPQAASFAPQSDQTPLSSEQAGPLNDLSRWVSKAMAQLPHENTSYAEADEGFELELNPVQEACLLIHDALLFTSHIHPRRGASARVTHVIAQALEIGIAPVIAFLVLLSFFELPSWCAKTYECKSTLHDGQLTGAYFSGRPFFGFNATEADNVKYPLFGIYILPEDAALSLELVAVVFLLVQLFCAIHAAGFRRFLYHSAAFNRQQLVYSMTLLFVILDCLVRFGVRTSKSDNTVWPPGYIAPYLRIILLSVNNPSILAQLRQVINTVRPLLGSLLVLAIFLLSMAWIALLSFASNLANSQGAQYFTNYWNTAWELYILLTTSNYPDVMMPGYNRARFSFVFFLFFVCFGTFFLMSVIVAVVCNEYNASMAREQKRHDAFATKSLGRAFDMLVSMLPQPGAPAGCLSKDCLHDLFKELNVYRRSITHISPERERLIYRALDFDNDAHVDRDEFAGLILLLKVHFKRLKPALGPVGRMCPSFFSSAAFQKLAACVEHRAFDWAVDLLLIVNLVILLIEEYAVLDGSKTTLELASWTSPVAIAFSSVFMVELALKLLVLGASKYLESFVNRFDGLVIIVTFVLAIYVACKKSVDAHVLLFTMTLRIARFFRLCQRIHSVHLVVQTACVHVLPAASRLLQVMFVSMYCFSAFGVTFFGGLINKGPQLATLNANASGFGVYNTPNGEYWANNFNDISSGMVVCFELLVVNNWYEICDGFSVVAPVRYGYGADGNGHGARAFVRIFFILVYVFGVLICLNVVVAFCIDAFENTKASVATNEGHDLAYVREHASSVISAPNYTAIYADGLSQRVSMSPSVEESRLETLERLSIDGLASPETLGLRSAACSTGGGRSVDNRRPSMPSVSEQTSQGGGAAARWRRGMQKNRAPSPRLLNLMEVLEEFSARNFQPDAEPGFNANTDRRRNTAVGRWAAAVSELEQRSSASPGDGLGTAISDRGSAPVAHV